MSSAPGSQLPAMAFSANSLNRLANHRQHAEFIWKLRSSENARSVSFNGDKMPVLDGVPVVVTGPVGENALFLGVDGNDTPWFATLTKEDCNLSDLRSLAVAGQVSSETLGILAQARSLLHWHERHGFCANCGAVTEIADQGYRRHCAACTADHFPRTDPVIIIAVTHGERMLLGRQASWAPGMFSTLAGFMEPGETIEDAARREVAEEAGIRVGAARVIANQPWPFPSSLMIGLVGEALTDHITVDPKELDDARWFSFDDVRLMMAKAHPDNLHTPPPMAIAHRLIVAAMQG